MCRPRRPPEAERDGEHEIVVRAFPRPEARVPRLGDVRPEVVALLDERPRFAIPPLSPAPTETHGVGCGPNRAADRTG